jgi:hypothetical protein
MTHSVSKHLLNGTTPGFPGRRARAALAILTAISLSACSADSTATAPDTTIQFSAVVSTTQQLSLAGTAGLISLPATGADSLSVPASALLILQDKKSAAQLGFEWTGTDIPATGTFQVGSSDSDVIMAYQDSSGAVYDGVGGTMIVTSVVDGVVSGTFSVTAAPSDTTGHTASIAGVFKAAAVTQ